jgi:hypothetical protein
LEQSVASSSSSSSSSIMPPSPQQQEQQPSQSLPSSSTITSFGNTSSNIIDNSNSSLMSTLPQVTSQLAQSQGSSRPLSQTIEPSLSERPADYNNTNIANDADNRVPNSTPLSTIKITSVDRSPEAIYSDLPLSMSNSTNQHYQSQGREQLQQRIQEIMNQFNSVNGNDGSSLPKYIERN